MSEPCASASNCAGADGAHPALPFVDVVAEELPPEEEELPPEEAELPPEDVELPPEAEALPPEIVRMASREGSPSPVERIARTRMK
jgi:hypothetical protein